MTFKNYILLIVIILIILSTGCIKPRPQLPFTFVDNTPISPCEVKNTTMILPLGNVAALDLETPGMYDITVETMVRSNSAIKVGYGYIINEQIQDRFGYQDNPIYYGWITPDQINEYYLGTTDSGHIVERRIVIPTNSIDQKLFFVVYNENTPTRILVKRDCNMGVS